MKHIYIAIFSLLTLLVLQGCSDSKEEPLNPVFAFSSAEKYISITNNGTNAVVNVSADYQEVTITLLGTFIHTDIESPSKWIKATVTDKVLTLKIDMNYGDNARSANIAIRANDQSEIVLAYIAVNQAGPTTEDYDRWQYDEISMILEMDGGSKDIPTNGELEMNTWYKVTSDNSVYFRVAIREENSELIKEGDIVYPSFSICHIYDMYYGSQWWLNSFYENYGNVVPYTVTSTPLQSAINEYGTGILDVINKAPIRYGDDIDIIQTSYAGIPKFADNHEANVYVVQYRKSLDSRSDNVAPTTVSKKRR